MRKLAALVFTLLVSAAASAGPVVDISYVHDAAEEKQTGEQLTRLLEKYDLSKWIVTRNIAIESHTIPHSDPVLTLHTRHLKDDQLLLSTFVHEQMHWYVREHLKDKEAAIAELKKLYPKTPVGYPQGSDTEAGNYEYMLVIDLEWQANRELFGELAARQIMEFWAHDHYTWIYQTVLDNRNQFDTIIKAHHLRPGSES